MSDKFEVIYLIVFLFISLLLKCHNFGMFKFTVDQMNNINLINIKQ